MRGLIVKSAAAGQIVVFPSTPIEIQWRVVWLFITWPADYWLMGKNDGNGMHCVVVSYRCWQCCTWICCMFSFARITIQTVGLWQWKEPEAFFSLLKIYLTCSGKTVSEQEHLRRVMTRFLNRSMDSITLHRNVNSTLTLNMKISLIMMSWFIVRTCIHGMTKAIDPLL